MTQRWKITIEYKGTNYKGWQRQPDVPSVQQCIEEAITKFCQQEISITVAGRTDAGVHAWGQVAHFDLDYRNADGTPRAISGFDLMKALNAHLIHEDVSILKAEEVDDEFHARFGATNKLYRYRLVNRAAFLSVERDLAWQYRLPLDIEAMRTAKQFLLGKHDFSTFRDSECQAKSPIRTLDRLDILTRPYDGADGTEIIFEVEGLSFLHHQVRNMVGTLAEVGKGRWAPQDVKTALEAKDRTKGGPTAPACGLYFVRVDYPDCHDLA